MPLRRTLGLSLLAALLALGGAAGWVVFLARRPAPIPPGAPVVVPVEIPPGTTLSGAARLLGKSGVVESPRFLVLLGKLTGRAGRVQAGEIAFRSGMTPLQALDTLAQGHAVLHPVTFPEGFTARQVAALLQEKGLADASRVSALASSASFARSLGVPAPSLEGFLYPDTYAWPKGTPPEAILRRMVERFGEKFDSGLRAQAAARGMSVLQAVTLASIVERETGAPAERRLVAGVFANRLRRGYRLQSDPTVIYGMPHFSGNLTRADLLRDTPYNTYTRFGLPPGPIANPGREALEAAVDPDPTPHLYFVARGDGTHVFASTLVEHNANVAAFQLRRRAR